MQCILSTSTDAMISPDDYDFPKKPMCTCKYYLIQNKQWKDSSFTWDLVVTSNKDHRIKPI